MKDLKSSMENQKLIVIEFNEINIELALEACNCWNLPNLEKILNYPSRQLICKEKDEHAGLDPWVQWVSIHSGMDSSKHKIMHLADTKNQQYPQIWNKLSQKGVSCGIAGAMNAPLNKHYDDTNIHFFIPDPWSHSEQCKPSPLDKIIAIPRYASKDYLAIKPFRIIKKIPCFVHGFLQLNLISQVFRTSLEAIKAIKTPGINIHTFTSLFDYFLTLVFVALSRKYQTRFSVIFINHIAHLQHQFWRGPLRDQKHMKFGFYLADKIIAELINGVDENTSIILINGLNQKNIADKNIPFYRQIDPDYIASFLGFKCKVEQNMTNDGYLIFDNTDDASAAEIQLTSVHLSCGSKIFFAKRISSKVLFYYINPNLREIRANELMWTQNHESIKFYSLFKQVCIRTGTHVPTCDIFFESQFEGKDLNYNYEIHDKILRYFNC